jgi:hypothetical protein
MKAVAGTVASARVTREVFIVGGGVLWKNVMDNMNFSKKGRQREEYKYHEKIRGGSSRVNRFSAYTMLQDSINSFPHSTLSKRLDRKIIVHERVRVEFAS